MTGGTGRIIHRTPSEGAAVLRRWAAVAGAAGVLAAALALFFPATSPVSMLLAAALLVAAVLVAGIAATRTSRSPELVWIVVGIGVFWVTNSTVYLSLLVRANTTLEKTVPSRETIDLLSTLFTAGVVALVAAALLLLFGWVIRPGRWHLMNGPGGQS